MFRGKGKSCAELSRITISSMAKKFSLRIHSNYVTDIQDKFSKPSVTAVPALLFRVFAEARTDLHPALKGLPTQVLESLQGSRELEVGQCVFSEHREGMRGCSGVLRSQ